MLCPSFKTQFNHLSLWDTKSPQRFIISHHGVFNLPSNGYLFVGYWIIAQRADCWLTWDVESSYKVLITGNHRHGIQKVRYWLPWGNYWLSRNIGSLHIGSITGCHEMHPYNGIVTIDSRILKSRVNFRWPWGIKSSRWVNLLPYWPFTPRIDYTIGYSFITWRFNHLFSYPLTRSRMCN